MHSHIFRTDTPERDQIDRILFLLARAKVPMRLVNDEGVSEEVPDRFRRDLVRLLTTALDRDVVLAQVIPDQIPLDEAASATNMSRHLFDDRVGRCPLDLSHVQQLGFMTRDELVAFSDWDRRDREEGLDEYFKLTEIFRDEDDDA